MLTLATILVMNFAQLGVDTLPPTMTVTAQGCGTRMILAEEMRNTPNPPHSLPNGDDQIDRGISSISFLADPKPVNVRIVLITDNQFPIAPSYKSFIARVELIDPSKQGSGVVAVRDFAGNIETRLVTIASTTPTASKTQIEAGTVFVGTTVSETITITNNTGAVATITDIHLQNGANFTITQGAIPPVLTLPVNGTHNITVTYKPTLTSEAGDADNLIVVSDCAELSIPTTGIGGVARITTEDWNAGSHMQFERVCKPNGINVTNGGNVNLVLQSAASTSPDFTYTPSPAFPITIPPGGNASIGDVCYEASSIGGASGFILVNSNANVGDTVAVLTAEAITTDVEDDFIKEDERTTSTEHCLMYDMRGNLQVDLASGLSTLRATEYPIGIYYIVYPDAPRRVRPLLLLR